MKGPLLTLLAVGEIVPGLVIVISLIVVVIVVVGIIFLVRNGNKNKAAANSNNGDWQRQAQPGAWNQQGTWGQQGQWSAPNQAAQPGNWAAGPQNPWGAPAQQQQSANPWGAPAEQQSANPWGAPAQQQQSANPWGAPAQQQQSANPWGAPAQQQQSANPWGAPAQQQQSANPWEAAPAPVAPAQDPWGQQQVAAAQQPAWGMQQANTSAPVQQGQQAPAAFGISNPPTAGWGQPQQADPWGAPNQAASPVAQPTGFPATVSSWQQGNPGTPGGTGFPGNEADKTILRSAPALQQNGIVGYVQVKEGKEPGKIYEIRKEALSIGRSRESDIFLEDLAVSRLHASIVNMGNGTYSLKDEGSANGTKVNDQLVDKFKTHPLQEGDQIQLGQTVLVFARR